MGGLKKVAAKRLVSDYNARFSGLRWVSDSGATFE